MDGGSKRDVRASRPLGADEGAERPAERRREAAKGVVHRRRLPSDDGASPRADPPPRRLRIAAGTLVLLAALAVGALILSGAFGGADDFFDDHAKEGQAPYKTPEEMQAELDRVVEEGMFGISIASVIPFADGASEGTAYIENVPGNRYLMRVSIALDETGETVYESKALRPGTYLERIVLTRDLDPGSYAATATFFALDPETREEAGRAGAKVTLSVEG